ncbi:hypothetical protein KA082_03475 [Candidatus Woesebacteria bacterium]|nr:hypothetical protein [Candidatus Woesebacteria bacterium]
MKKIAYLIPMTLLFSACSFGQSATTTTIPVTPVIEQSMVGNKELSQLAELVQAGKAVSCILIKKDDGTTMQYDIKGAKMKMVGVTTTGQAKTGSMISDGTYMYSWTEGETKGFKIKVPTKEEAQNMAAQANPQQVPDLTAPAQQKRYQDMGFTLDCKESTATDSDFVPPAQVEFVDMSVSMEKMQKLIQKDADSTQAVDQEAADKQAVEFMKQMGQ